MPTKTLTSLFSIAVADLPKFVKGDCVANLIMSHTHIMLGKMKDGIKETAIVSCAFDRPGNLLGWTVRDEMSPEACVAEMQEDYSNVLFVTVTNYRNGRIAVHTE